MEVDNQLVMDTLHGIQSALDLLSGVDGNTLTLGTEKWILHLQVEEKGVFVILVATEEENGSG